MKTKPPMFTTFDNRVDGGGPLFPVVTCDRNLDAKVIAGADMLDYFAAHAPTVIPTWFEIETDPLPPEPQRLSIFDAASALPAFAALSPGEQGSVLAWLRDGTWDLEGREKAAADEAVAAIHASLEAIEEWKAKQAAWIRQKAVDTFFAWRWFYAHQMLRHRPPTI